MANRKATLTFPVTRKKEPAKGISPEPLLSLLRWIFADLMDSERQRPAHAGARECDSSRHALPQLAPWSPAPVLARAPRSPLGMFLLPPEPDRPCPDRHARALFVPAPAQNSTHRKTIAAFERYCSSSSSHCQTADNLTD